jgi:hypothetical protein
MLRTDEPFGSKAPLGNHGQGRALGCAIAGESLCSMMCTILGLYRPLDPSFNTTWTPDDIESQR